MCSLVKTAEKFSEFDFTLGKSDFDFTLGKSDLQTFAPFGQFRSTKKAQNECKKV